MTEHQVSLRVDGFAVVRGLISEPAAADIAAELSRISRPPADRVPPPHEGALPEYYEHGGVARHPGLWSLLVHPGVIATAHKLLDGPPKCLPGIDTIGMHASETAPHRDASPAELPTLAQDPFGEHCPLLRIIFYPDSPGERFGCLPGSHRLAGRPSDLMNGRSADWRWTELHSGDAVAFDPRLVHAGTPVTRPKPMVIVTYGLDGSVALETYFHARIKTAQLGFSDPAPGLLDLLDRSGVLLNGVTDSENWDRFSTVWLSGP